MGGHIALLESAVSPAMFVLSLITEADLRGGLAVLHLARTSMHYPLYDRSIAMPSILLMIL